MPAENKYTFSVIGSDETKRMFKSIHASVRKTVNVAGAMGAGVAAGLAIMVTRSMQATTEMTRLAHGVGVNTEAMSEWGHAAKTVNLEADKMADIFKDVADKIGDIAITGGGGAIDMFEKLNLNIEDFIGLAPDQQLLKIGEALDDVDSRAEKIFFLEALAGDASRLLPLLENGAEDLKALQDEARELGVSVSEIDAAKIEIASRSMEKVQSIIAATGRELAVTFAPIIEVIAEKLVAVSTEAGGSANIIKRGFSVGAKVVGVMADGVHGVQVIFKGLELIATGMNAVIIGGFVKIIDVTNKVGNAIIDGIATPIRKILELAAPLSDMAAEALTKVDAIVGRMKAEVPAAMQAFADAQIDAFSIAKDELHALLMEDLPSNVIMQNIDKLLNEVDARVAEKVAEVRAKLTAGTGKGVGITATADEEAEKIRMATGARLVALDERYLTELQQLQVKFANELQLIQEAEDQKIIIEEDANARRLRATADFEGAKTDLAKAEQHARLAMQVGGLRTIASVNLGESKKIFKVQKAAALAAAAVALPSAVLQSWEKAHGYPWGIIPAAAMLATGLAEIKAIKSAKFGGGYSGGGSRGGGAGGGYTPSTPSTPAIASNLGGQFSADQAANAGRQTILNLTITGDVIGDSAETILNRITELVEDQDFIIFGPNSRQAQEIIPG